MFMKDYVFVLETHYIFAQYSSTFLEYSSMFLEYSNWEGQTTSTPNELGPKPKFTHPGKNKCVSIPSLQMNRPPKGDMQ